MDPKYEIKPCPNPHHHHHHHLHNNHHHCQSFFFPHHHHHHHHHHCHRHVIPNFAPLPQTLEPFGSHALPNNHTVEASENGGPVDSAPRVLQEQEDYGLEEEEEEDDEPIFVLTDEWRDFFAKSEAKRKLEKKQAKKGKK